jgi:hypothetical protein
MPPRPPTRRSWPAATTSSTPTGPGLTWPLLRRARTETTTPSRRTTSPTRPRRSSRGWLRRTKRAAGCSASSTPSCTIRTAYQQAFAGTPQAVPGRCLPSGPCVPIWYLEAEFQTRPRPGSTIYFNLENVLTIPDVSSGEPESPAPLATSAAPDQATQLRWALRLAYCQPYVEAVFNFLIRDDPNLLGYQSGVLWADWQPKGSYASLGAVVSQLAAGNVSCAAPSAPPSLDAQVQPGPKVSLRWGGSSSAIGVSGYRVYRNGAVVGTTADRSYVDSSIPAVAGYRYAVRGFDAAGQTGPASDATFVSSSAIAAATAAAGAARGKGCRPLYVRTSSKASLRAFRIRVVRGKVSCLKAQRALRTLMIKHRAPKPWRCVRPHGKAQLGGDLLSRQTQASRRGRPRRPPALGTTFHPTGCTNRTREGRMHP